jgi:hypothetical protein
MFVIPAGAMSSVGLLALVVLKPGSKMSPENVALMIPVSEYSMVPTRAAAVTVKLPGDRTLTLPPAETEAPSGVTVHLTEPVRSCSAPLTIPRAVICAMPRSSIPVEVRISACVSGVTVRLDRPVISGTLIGGGAPPPVPPLPVWVAGSLMPAHPVAAIVVKEAKTRAKRTLCCIVRALYSATQSAAIA